MGMGPGMRRGMGPAMGGRPDGPPPFAMRRRMMAAGGFEGANGRRARGPRQGRQGGDREQMLREIRQLLEEAHRRLDRLEGDPPRR